MCAAASKRRTKKRPIERDFFEEELQTEEKMNKRISKHNYLSSRMKMFCALNKETVQ